MSASLRNTLAPFVPYFSDLDGAERAVHEWLRSQRAALQVAVDDHTEHSYGYVLGTIERDALVDAFLAALEAA
jgi:hypothetical protein